MNWYKLSFSPSLSFSLSLTLSLSFSLSFPDFPSFSFFRSRADWKKNRRGKEGNDYANLHKSWFLNEGHVLRHELFALWVLNNPFILLYYFRFFLFPKDECFAITSQLPIRALVWTLSARKTLPREFKISSSRCILCPRCSFFCLFPLFLFFFPLLFHHFRFFSCTQLTRLFSFSHHLIASGFPSANQSCLRSAFRCFIDFFLSVRSLCSRACTLH